MPYMTKNQRQIWQKRSAQIMTIYYYHSYNLIISVIIIMSMTMPVKKLLPKDQLQKLMALLKALIAKQHDKKRL